MNQQSYFSEQGTKSIENFENKSVKYAKSNTNPDCCSTKQVRRQVQDQGYVVQAVAQGDGQGGSQTMGFSKTQLGTRQRAWLGTGRKLNEKK